MQNKYLYVVLKFVTGYLLVQFILKRVIFLTRSIITSNEYYIRLENENFLIFTIKGFFGDWGTSFHSEKGVNQIITEPLRNTLYFFVFAILIASLISFTIIYFLDQLDNRDKILSYFTGNWLIYLSIIFAFSYLLYSELYITLSYLNVLAIDTFVLLIFIGTNSFYFGIISVGFLGGLKILSEASIIPSLSTKPQDVEVYPKSTSTEVPEMNENGSHQTSSSRYLETLTLFALGLKSSIVPILEFVLIYEVVFNIPGLGNLLLFSCRIVNIPVIMAIMSYMILFVVLISLIFELILVFIEGEENEIILNHQHEKSDDSQGFIILIFSILTYLILILIVISWLTGLILDFNFGTTGLLKNPYSPNFQNGDQPPFSPNHILGTDQFGMDVFSNIFVGLSIYFVPLLVSIIIRPVLVLLLDRYAKIKNIDIRYPIIDILSILPKFPILMLITILPNEIEYPYQMVFPSFLLSIIFIGEIGKKYYRSNYKLNSTSLLSKFFLLVDLTIITVIIEIFLISYSVGLPGAINFSGFIGLISFRRNIGGTISLLTVPVLFICIISVYAMNRVRNS